ncbi:MULTISPECIES: aliphatic sulfonate ABC transporter substrate-binding protein [Rhizobium/Agrobacterium group]|uniref:Aliphatic sulfonate ABC transporter substrate-binding protein n=6 Tax=Rhizobium/Agrobacterium group TaxID=227290 RepID=A0ABS3EMW3_9HYPH|nr:MULTISPECIES: aliphatic sulfonate ABC transporter substrate-binding protein [Rhizobium/Agrobacterium group]OCJ08334.1 nitrate ABC transporter substrate-binding protein [Agrobacterium sp. B131/95]AAK91019.1 ABC transporter, substrate binding protein (nitrate/sulfonate) [Agrobacterium fabrum str. C58]ASK42238.1 nitrate ABC transporter substrate-binding protein [Agrobacterium sp.]ASK42592.1 nitrate ABC transporter substrate-binding protein [Agrobacterium fabrum str. C58]ASK43263.1 nitrate ABC 
MLKKNIAKTATALVAAALLWAGSAAAETVNIGFMPFVPYSAILLAKQKGWVDEEFTKAGLKDVEIKWHQFAGGPPVNEAFASGALDIAALGDTPSLIAFANGIDTRFVGLACKGAKAEALIVLKDSSVKTVKDLKGKKVATLRGGNVHELLVLVLAEAGLKISDVEFLNLGLQDMGIALTKGDVDAVLVWEPLLTKLDSEGVSRTLRDGAGLKSNLNPIVALGSFAAKHPDVLKAYLQAVKRGAEALRSDPAGSAQVLAPVVGLTPKQTELAFSRFEWKPTVTEADQAELADSVKFLLDNHFIRQTFEVSSFADQAFFNF